MKIAGILIVFVFEVCLTMGAFAQDYPTKAVKVVVPYTAGSATDTFGRIVSEKLSALWGQPVTVENKPGAGGSVGAGEVAKAPPDGYTLLFSSSSHAVNPALYSRLPYDPQKDLVDVAPVSRQPFVLVVGEAAGIKSAAELTARANAKKGQIKFGSAGIGSGTHLVAEKFRMATGIEAEHVPYKGGPEANADTIAGKVTYWFPPVAMALKEVRAGRLIALGVTASKRSGMLPEVPTMAEAGVAGVEDVNWWGLWAPAGIPAAVVDKLAKDVALAVASPDVREKFAKLGAEPMSMSSAEFSKFVRSETEAAAQAVKAAGIKPQ